jgi:hypothetical protein
MEMAGRGARAHEMVGFGTLGVLFPIQDEGFKKEGISDGTCRGRCGGCGPHHRGLWKVIKVIS